MASAKCNVYGLPEIGVLIRVIKNSTCHKYTIGEVYRVKTHASKVSILAESIDGKWTGNVLRASDYEIVKMNKDHYRNVIAGYQSKIDEVNSIIDWMDEVGADEYDEKEYKVWKVLSAMDDSTMSKIDKVKAIAALINQ